MFVAIISFAGFLVLLCAPGLIAEARREAVARDRKDRSPQ